MISRAEAKEQGLTRFNTGEPCKYGHLAERMVSTRQCVVCTKERNKTLRKTSIKVKETCKKTRCNTRQRLKAQVMAGYGGKCACCGEIELIFLNIDHINQDGSEQRKALGSRSGDPYFYRWLRDNNYPEGYRVLCFNCNFAVYHLGVCPHQGASK